MKISPRYRLITALASNKLADLLISAKTTLPALLIFVGAPVWMVGWLVPIRESGALLPQALIGVLLRKVRSRHWVWRIGIVVQATAVAVMAGAALMFDSTAAGFAVLIALILLSIGRSACSLTMKDIQADVVEKGRRGRLLGIASTVSGLLTLLVAAPLVWLKSGLGEHLLLGIIGLAWLAFVLTFIVMMPVKTFVDTESNGSKAGNKTRFWQFDSVVYKFVLVRGIFVHSALVAPYFMLESGAEAEKLLPLYLCAQAAATMLSSFIWGKIADTSARATLQLAGGIAAIACGLLLLLSSDSVWISALLFFVLSIAHTGVRTGRKTYSLDVREGQARTELVAFSNTAIGVILLIFGALYAALTPLLSFSVVYIMLPMLIVGIALTWILPAEKS